jgi:type I restriction enzyme S subunit
VSQVKDAMNGTTILTQSILTRAYNGKLIPTEAELARREGREYEPSDKLLERIKNSK